MARDDDRSKPGRRFYAAARRTWVLWLLPFLAVWMATGAAILVKMHVPVESP